MAKRSELDTSIQEAPEVVSVPVAPENIPGYVQVVNKTSHEIDITLADGRNLHVGPRTRCESYNRSEWTPKKLIPPYVRTLVIKGDLQIIETSSN